jgi:hypothetical protein
MCSTTAVLTISATSASSYTTSLAARVNTAARFMDAGSRHARDKQDTQHFSNDKEIEPVAPTHNRELPKK